MAFVNEHSLNIYPPGNKLNFSLRDKGFRSLPPTPIQTMLKLSRGGLDLKFGFYAERNTSQHCLIGGRGGARMLIPGTEVKFVAVLIERNGFRG